MHPPSSAASTEIATSLPARKEGSLIMHSSFLKGTWAPGLMATSFGDHNGELGAPLVPALPF
jgi:hypothetical protein